MLTDGYYWLKMFANSSWDLCEYSAEWDEFEWARESVKSSDVYEINPARVLSPDEQENK